MTKPWFRPAGWLFRPVALPGYLAVALTLAFWVMVFLAIDRHSHSASDTLIPLFPFVASSFLLLDWLAARTGGR